jgi:threonine dehydrogenase-like Zn-dependent dehydrogenase
MGAEAGGVNERTRVTVIGDGAVGLMAVLSAKRLGAEQIILMGRHPARTDLGQEFGATDVVSARGEEGIAQVRELTGGHGTHVVLEAVGHMPAYEQAVGVVRPGGVISRVGVPSTRRHRSASAVSSATTSAWPGDPRPLGPTSRN